MSDTISMEDRVSALDSFANAGPQQTTQLPAVSSTAPPPMIVHGAQLIAGNKRDPRGLMDEVDAMASMMGEDVFYSIPFKDKRKGTTTFVEGISIDGAMMVHQAYGNAGVHAWVHSEGYDYWDILALWQDHEKGVEVSRMFRQRKGASRMGGGDVQRNQEAALQIGISKAERNVIANALKYLCNRAHRVAKSGLAEKIGKDIEGWRKRIAARLVAANIPLDRVEAVIGRKSDQWLTLDIVKVIERAKSITEGEASLDDTFPPLQTEDQPDELGKLATHPDPDPKHGHQEKPAAGAEAAPAAGDQIAPSRVPEALRLTYEEMVTKLLRMASDEATDEQFKLEQLEQAGPWWEDQLPSDWHGKIKAALQTAGKVASGKLGMADAKKYLMGL